MAVAQASTLRARGPIARACGCRRGGKSAFPSRESAMGNPRPASVDRSVARIDTSRGTTVAPSGWEMRGAVDSSEGGGGYRAPLRSFRERAWHVACGWFIHTACERQAPLRVPRGSDAPGSAPASPPSPPAACVGGLRQGLKWTDSSGSGPAHALPRRSLPRRPTLPRLRIPDVSSRTLMHQCLRYRSSVDCDGSAPLV